MIFRLNGSVAHLWQVETTHIDVQRLLDLLSAEECARAERFRQSHDRARFVIGRAVLKRLLGQYLDRAPTHIHLQTSHWGKPVLADVPQLNFNLSHSEEQIIVGFSTAGPVGVDIERIREVPDLEDMTRRYFGIRERAAISGAAKEARPAAFFRAWTRKEAYLKMLGTGLIDDPSKVDCNPGPDGTLSVSSPHGCTRLAVHEYGPSRDYLAALVCGRPDIRVSQFTVRDLA